MNKPIDRVGQVFGRLTVLEFVGYRAHQHSVRRSVWRCRCKCGNEIEVTAKILVCGASKSCGCLQKERVSQAAKTHGMSKTKLYKVWTSMKQRCHSPSDPQYHLYGGRGIYVCDEWRASFEAFFSDVGRPPQRGMSLDRIDNAKGYSPSNVRWATVSQQLLNTRRNRHLTLQGRRLTLLEWSKELGINYSTLSQRLRNGWSDERVLQTPVNAALARR